MSKPTNLILPALLMSCSASSMPMVEDSFGVKIPCRSPPKRLRRFSDAFFADSRVVPAYWSDDTTVMFQLGAVLDRAGRRAEAEKAFRDVIARDPLDANALNYLGYMLAERGGAGSDEAVAALERWLWQGPPLAKVDSVARQDLPSAATLSGFDTL